MTTTEADGASEWRVNGTKVCNLPSHALRKLRDECAAHLEGGDNRPDSGERELDPCPFCGSDLVYIETLEYDDPASPKGWRPRCTECGVMASAYLDRERAVHRWNCRADRPSSTEGAGERRFGSWGECREAYRRDPVLYNFVHSLIAESHNSARCRHNDDCYCGLSDRDACRPGDHHREGCIMWSPSDRPDPSTSGKRTDS